MSYSDSEFIEAIRDADGVVRDACRRLECSPSTFYRRMQESDEIREAVDEARGSTYSQAVGVLVETMRGETDLDREWATEKIVETFGEKVRDGLDWTDKERTEHTAEAPSLPEYADVGEVREQLEDQGLELPEHTDPNPNGHE